MTELGYLQPAGTVDSRRRARPRAPASLAFGAGGVLLLASLFFAGPRLVPYAPNDHDLAHRLQAPGLDHWLGTDNFGRDLFARLLHAGQLDLQIALAATSIAFLTGSGLGALAGYYGGVLDAVLMRILDVLLAFPSLVLAIAVVGLLGSGLPGLLVALGLVGWVPYARLVRGEVLATKHLDYVLAATALGCSDGRLLWRHVLPHSISPALVYAASSVTFNILAITSLGYLGVGLQPPQAEWGAMIAEGRSFILSSPELVLWPSLMLTLTGLTFGWLGDGLADALAPAGGPPPD